MIFLGLASNYRAKDIFCHSFILGSKKDYNALEEELADFCNAVPEKVSLIYSGRSAISLALKSFIKSGFAKKGDFIAVNSFTCYAVIEAIKNAGLKPLYIDLEETKDGKILPNFSLDLLEIEARTNRRLRGVIVQNTFGEIVDLNRLADIVESNDLFLLEDVAHCAGRFYELYGKKIPVGSYGDAVAFSFGKGKAIDTITGGAVILRHPGLFFPKKFEKENLVRRKKNGDVPRASWYPLFGAIARGLSHLNLEKFWLGFLLKFKWIERSADTKLQEDTTITYWQARLARHQLKNLKDKPLREYYLVDNREEVLVELRKNGFRLDEFWYEVPVAPKRYFKPEKTNYYPGMCPNAEFFAEHVVNLPTWYKDKRHKKEVSAARKIIKKHEI